MSTAIGQITRLGRSYLASVFDPMVDEFDFCELIQIDGGFRWSIHDSLHNALRRMVNSEREM
jgi:hypothetical protein